MAGEAPRKFRPVKTPTVLQMEAAECGAAALGIILEYHGRYVPLDVLRDDCGVSRDGSNALYIKEAAKRYGLEVKAIPQAGRRPVRLASRRSSCSGSGITSSSSRASRGKVYLNDPASGRRTVSQEEFARSTARSRSRSSRAPNSSSEGDARVRSAGWSAGCATSRAALAFVILAGLALVIPTLASAAYQRVFIDEILVQGHRDWLRPLLIAMGLTGAAPAGGGRPPAGLPDAAGDPAGRSPSRCDSSSTSCGYRSLLPASLRRRYRRPDHRLGASGRTDLGRAGDHGGGPAHAGRLRRRHAPLDPLLTAVGVAISSLNLVVLRWFSRWRIDQNRSIEQIRGRLWAGVMWAIQIIESIKATGSESDLMVRWTGDQARMINAEQQLGAYDALLVVIPPLLSSLTTIVVLGLGGRQVTAGTLSIGALVAFQSLLVSFNQPFRDLARLGADVQELRADLDRIDDVRHHRIDPVLEPAPASTAFMEHLTKRGQKPVLPRLSRPYRVPLDHVRLQPDGRGAPDPATSP